MGSKQFQISRRGEHLMMRSKDVSLSSQFISSWFISNLMKMSPQVLGEAGSREIKIMKAPFTRQSSELALRR